MAIHPIRNDADHARALARMDALWQAPSGSDDAAELDALATLVDAYEERQYPIAGGEPIEVLRYAIDEMGHSQSELAELLGSRSRASEILSGKRALTLDMIRVIAK
ncbi:MAG: helix-turn-helix domain-containing protein, partial [Hyphomicrobiales bacterium]|nr:helix-turn-helix domain-containing protein [Hyphomicrobiales bacterium]